MTKLLVDGDILLYQTATAVEEEIDWGDDIWTLHGDMAAARSTVDITLRRFHTRLGGSGDILIMFSDPNLNWRKSILPSYKSNRRGHRKPVVYKPLKEYLCHTRECYQFPSLEGDDVLGLFADEDTIIISDDKDMRTIAGRLYIPHTDEEITITQEEADRNHLLQALTGDSVDGYKGCPRVGPVSADKILKEGTWSEVVEAYAKKGLSESVALQQATVAYILRKGDYDIDRCKFTRKIWEPIQ
jgi:DNA polymerase-1